MLFYFKSLTTRFHHPIAAFGIAKQDTKRICEMLRGCIRALSRLELRPIIVVCDMVQGFLLPSRETLRSILEPSQRNIYVEMSNKHRIG